MCDGFSYAATSTHSAQPVVLAGRPTDHGNSSPAHALADHGGDCWLGVPLGSDNECP